tara:strand:- start:4059 stop:4256 length:198 start_codon:yes stop_codon:yes gene_type:complete
MSIFFKNELPLDHEESLDEIVKQWSKDDSEEDGFHWEHHRDRNWYCLEEWLKEFEGLEMVEGVLA